MPQYVQAVLRASTDVGGGVRLLTLQDPDGWALPPFKPGAHLLLYLAPGLMRAYSICGDPAVSDRYHIAVKREANGRGGSCFVHDRLRVGEPVKLSLPRCTFPLAPHAARHLFVAGGIGVTPFLSMAAALETSGTDYALHLLSRGAPPFADRLAQLIARGNAVVHDTLSGRPDLRSMIGRHEPDVHVYGCGPAGLMSAFAEATHEWPPDSVHTEYFGLDPAAAKATGSSFKLVLARSGRDTVVQGGADLLEAVEMLGAHVESSCRGGVCGACRVRWLKGPPIHRDRVLRPDERLREVALCVAGCSGPELVLDL